MPQKKWLILVAGAVLAAAVYFLPARKAPQSSTAETASDYIDPAACAGCHQAIAKTYRLTGMARSMYRPRPGAPVEDFTSRNSFYHQASDRYYTMSEREGKVFQTRHQVGFGGKPTNAVEKQVDFVIGSGNHARSYVYRNAEGKLLEMPVTWYAERGGYWGMSPGYDRADHLDFRRAIGADCLFCHNGFPTRSDQVPEGIDCQRCHGPGRRHAEVAGTGKASPDAIRRAIVNPARLSREQQLETCMQCHLETTSSPLPHIVPRYERAAFAFRPGQVLSDSFLFFDHQSGTGHDDKFEIAHAAYRLRKSACFQASQMTCTTCHNPHDIPRGPEAAAQYVAACKTCHPAGHTKAAAAGENCIDCHMPRRRAEDAVHVVMTDHYIQRRKPSRDLLAPLAEAKTIYAGEVVPYYGERAAQTPGYELYTAVAQVQDGANLPAGIPRLRAAIEKSRPAEPEFYFELGKAYSKAGNPVEAISWFEQALAHRADFTRAAKELSGALIAAGQVARAAEILEKLPPDSGVLADLGNVYLRQGRDDAALQVLQNALNKDPDAPGANNLLAMAWSRKGDGAAAEKYFRQAIAMQPDFAEAHNNLANLLAASKDYAQAAYHFEKALGSNPAYAEAHHSFGLLLILSHDYDRALQELRESVRLAPNAAQAHADLADVLLAKGQVPQAANEYRLAIGLRPDFYEAHLSLGVLLLRLGQAAEARTHLEKAAQSPDADLRMEVSKVLR
ncbi:MAG: tetratricopeptide repeat protein [Candidatus Solibacter sp.]